jgi:phosphate transport system substrate-binding protein
VTGAGNLASDVIVNEPRTLPSDPDPLPPTTAIKRRTRAVGAVLVAALAAGALAALVVVPLLRGQPTTPSALPAEPNAAASAPPREVVLRLCGSYTIATELAPNLVEGFLRGRGVSNVGRERVGSEWRWIVSPTSASATTANAVEIAGDGSPTAFEGLASGRCDVGMASRRVHPDEAARLKQLGLGDMTSPGNEHVLGLEGIAIIVHPNNPVHSLSLPDLKQIFSGASTDWSKLGGPSSPVHVFARDDQSATMETFKQLVLGGGAISDQAKRFPINDSLADAVASDTAAIGFVGFGHVRGARPVAVSTPGAPGIYPSKFTVGTEDYPLMRRLYLYTSERPTNPATREFVSFALSTEGQGIVKAAGFIDLGIWMRDAEDVCHDGCPARYASLVKRARRLSLDFRFQTTTSDLDTRAMRDLDRVVAFLSTLSAPKVVLMGFADANEAAKDKVRLSVERAKKVSAELAARGVHASVVEGFGDVMLVPTAGGAAEHARNRRVEIWVGTRDER